MATSGSVDFNQTRNEIITDAFALLNVYAPSDTIKSDDMQFASNQLNKMIKAWQAQGIHLWKKKEATLFLALNQSTYTLSPTGDNATQSYVETTISADEATGQTTLSITSSSGMSVNDYIGIVLDSGDLQWTTISSIPTATSVVIAAALTDDASEDNAVYSYTTKINRPLAIYSARRNSVANQDTPMFKYAYEEYFDLPNKTAPGIPTTYTYNPQLNAGLLYVWPAAEDVSDKIKFTYYDPIEDFDSAADTPDFPAEWLEVLTYQLAVRMSHRYGKRALIRDLKNDADFMLQNLLDWDNEEASIYFQPAKY